MTDEPAKVDLETPDLAADNRALFESMFPGVLADGVIDPERLGALLDVPVAQVADGRERYGLMWAGKQDAVRSLLTPSRGTLLPDLENSVDFDTAENVFIEGDNLEVLKLLQKAYNDKVKLIYIDPPYNTGSNDFIYPDDFSDTLRAYLEYTGQVDADGRRLAANADTLGRRHSRWLSMMYPRLVLARNLLSQDGVMMVSIDDNEVANLRCLLDEVFGPENFAVTFVWQKKKKPSFLHKNVGTLTEYVLCVTRNTQETFPFSVDVTTAGKKYPLNNAGNSMTTLTFPAGSVQFAEESAVYPPQDMSEGNIVTHLLDEVTVVSHRNQAVFRLQGEWRYGQGRLNEIIASGEVITISKAPFRPNHVKVGGEIKKMHNLLSPTTYATGTNEDGSAELEALLGGAFFDNPKPTSLLRTLCRAVTYDDPSALVLDFFAGSGTTAQAVMQLNGEDGGHRRCISVNLPEPTMPGSRAHEAGYLTVSQITVARMRAAVVETGTMNGLRVFRLGESAFATQSLSPDLDILDLSPATLVAEDRDFDSIALEVLLKEGVPLDVGWSRHKVGEFEVILAGGVAVVLSLDLSASVVEGVLGLGARVVVFLEDGFSGADAVKANAFTNAKNANITMKTV